jgi:hypothetical protein
VYSPALTDFIFMVDGSSYMFITGPDVISTVTHEDVTKDQLGGAVTHNSTSGVAHFLAHGDAECLQMIRELMSYLPQNNRDGVPPVAPARHMERVFLHAEMPQHGLHRHKPGCHGVPYENTCFKAVQTPWKKYVAVHTDRVKEVVLVALWQSQSAPIFRCSRIHDMRRRVERGAERLCNEGGVGEKLMCAGKVF